MNGLTYGPKKREDGKGQKNRAVAALVAAGVLFAVIQILTPFAREYSWKRFEMAPIYLLQYVLRPFALVLLGWGIVEAGKAFGVIRIWEDRTERTVRTFRVIFYMSAAILAVFAVLGLWTTIDLTYRWWQLERMMSLREDFDSSTIPQLMPWQLEGIYLFVSNHLGGAGLFLGAALGLCKVKKQDNEKVRS